MFFQRTYVTAVLKQGVSGHRHFWFEGLDRIPNSSVDFHSQTSTPLHQSEHSKAAVFGACNILQYSYVLNILFPIATCFVRYWNVAWSWKVSVCDAGNLTFAYWILKSSGDYAALSSEVLSTHAVLLEVGSNVEKFNLSTETNARLALLTSGCRNVLDSLDASVCRFDRLSTTRGRLKHCIQRAKDRTRWILEIPSDVRT